MGEKKDNQDKEELLQEVPVVLDRSSMPASPHTTYDTTREPSKAKLRFLSAAALIILSLSGGVIGGWLAGKNENSNNMTPAIEKQQVVLKSQGKLISTIANEVSPSVVSVEVTQNQSASGFFGLPETLVRQGAGTGIIFDKSGLIVTNRHVIPAGATNVNVVLTDGTKFEGVEIVGRTADSDPLDVAFLKIKDTQGKQLVAARLGDSSKMKVGESVIAIGNALGQFQNTVTSGIISGHGRNLMAGDDAGSSSERLQNLFQTDAAINQGNSGGPLVNMEGVVIGINTAVAGGNAENIGFAIPINDVKGLINSVLTKGKLERPYLGVVYVPVTPNLAKYYQLSVDQGAYIPLANAMGQPTVIKGGPADKAGLKAGDIIVKIDNENIDEDKNLSSLMGKHQPGDRVKITFVRDGKSQTTEAALGAITD